MLSSLFVDFQVGCTINGANFFLFSYDKFEYFINLSLHFIFIFLGKYCFREGFSPLDEAGKREEYKVAVFSYFHIYRCSTRLNSPQGLEKGEKPTGKI